MNVTQTIRAIDILPTRAAVLLEGQHGIGKSQVVAQLAARKSMETKKDFRFVDIRLGQYEVGDLIGIPEKRDTFTVTHKVYRGGKIVECEQVATNVTWHCEAPLLATGWQRLKQNWSSQSRRAVFDLPGVGSADPGGPPCLVRGSWFWLLPWRGWASMPHALLAVRRGH